MTRYKYADKHLNQEEVYRIIHDAPPTQAVMRRLLPIITSTGISATAGAALSSRLGLTPAAGLKLGILAPNMLGFSAGCTDGQWDRGDLRTALRRSKPGLMRRIAQYVVPGLALYDLKREEEVHERVGARFSSREQLEEALAKIRGKY